MTAGDTTVEFVRRCRFCGSPLSATSSFCSKCGATAEMYAEADKLRDRVQQLFGKDLEIEGELGRGGMAAVFGAFDPGLHRRVAVKVLLPEIANDRTSSDRFLREARTVAALNHPNVVTVYSVKSGDGVYAIVMQFVEGRSLDAALQERGQLPVHVAGMLLSQAAAGLQHAHERGVIHRDVKPANVLIDHEGKAVVSDFGIARRESGPRTTETGFVVGTWAYMSPEQRTADSVTAATDQYALGVMAFELLTGRLPFTGSPQEMLRAHLHDAPPSVRTLRPEVSPAMDALIQRMMAKDPAARFPSLKEPERLFRTLVPDDSKTTLQLASYSKVVQKGSSVVGVAVTRPPQPSVRSAPTERAPATADAATERMPAPHEAPPAPAKSNTAGIAIVAAAVVVVAVGAWMMRGSKAPGPQAPGSGGAPAAGAPNVASQSRPTQQAPANASRGDARPSASGSGSGSAGTVLPSAPVAAPLGGGGSPASGAAAPIEQPRTDPKPVETAAPKPDAAAPAPAGPALPAAGVADARKLARDFVTLLNQHRYRELGQLPAMGGDATTRADVLKLAETASDFAAGFDRVASPPGDWQNGFETDFVLDLQWRGGQRLVRVKLYAARGESGWRVAGVAMEPGS